MALAHDPVRFEVGVDPALAATFEWRKDGVLLPGAVAAVLDLPAVTAADEGGYSVTVTPLDRNKAVSRTATLRVVDRIFRVASSDDSGPGTLRNAVEKANALSGTTGIFIEPDAQSESIRPRLRARLRTVLLQASLPPILRDMVIEGPGDGETILQCSGGFRPFFVASGRVELADLTISGGYAKGGDSWGGGGAAGLGGALFVDGGEVLLDHVTFKHNQAVGGSSFPATDGLHGGGAGCSGNAPMGGAGGPGAPFCGLPGPGELLPAPQNVAQGGNALILGDCYGDGAGGGAASGATLLNWGGTGGWAAGGGFATAPGIGGDGGGNTLGGEWFAGGGGGILDPSNELAAYGAGGLWGGSGDRFGQGGGGAGLGGAIFLRRGQISRMIGCIFTSNQAIAGQGAPLPEDGARAMAKGGAIYIYPRPYTFPVNGISPVKTTCGGDDLIYPVAVLKAQRYYNNVALDGLRGHSDDNPDFYLANCSQAPIIIQDPLSQKVRRSQR